MANLPETPQWEEGIYQIEVSDPVLGGPDGISNRQGKQLASRTLYLKQQVEKGGTDLANHIAAADPHTQYAPKASPTFTGTPTAPTPANSDNSKKLATTEFVAKALAALAGSAPETLDTLKELADALGNNPNFATTVLNKLAEKLAKDQNGADIPDPALFVKNLGLVNNGAVGRLIGRPRIITSSGTYTPTSGAKFAWVQIVGGGGGGGGATASQNFNAAGGGGGAGGYAAKWVDLSSISSVVVTIGAGGNGASASGTNGSSGGITSFGSIFSASGGALGNSAVGTGNNTSTIVGAGNQGGTGTGGDLNCSGGSGLGGVSASPTIAGASVGPGIGGSSILSGPGGYGAGGNGGATVANSVPGSSGRSGIAIIWEYA